ncbi:WhiB family transcriptional regulator [Kitasatospora sp. NPDC087315]|uniref:WhiB family transcriptional regulator n=1 Tax=Kitasatospora sp. NPDC087315 TaxID=3364069 RepID=UPI0037F7A9D5
MPKKQKSMTKAQKAARARLIAWDTLTRADGYANRSCAPTDDGIDPDKWLSDKANDIIAAKRGCTGCPVRKPCAAYAIEFGETGGVWGGLTEDDRQKARRKLARAGHCQRDAEKAADTAREQGLANELAEPDGTVVRTAFQVELVAALRATGGDLRAATALLGSSYSSTCSMYRALAERAGIPDLGYEHIPEVLARIAEVTTVSRTNLARAA